MTGTRAGNCWLSRFAAIEHISPEIQKKRGNPLALAATIDWLEKRGITFTSHVFTDHDHIKWMKVETIWTDANAFGRSVYSGRKAALEALKGAKEARQAATDKAVREE